MSRRYCLSGLVTSFGAGLVVATVLQLDVEILQLLQHRAVQSDPAPVVHAPEQPSASPAAVVAKPQAPASKPQPAPADSDFSEDPVAALQRMQASCAFWTQRANDANGKVFRDRACSEMRQYAARTGQRSPRVEATNSIAKKESRKSARTSPLYVRECTEHRQGSISYRRCRAEESQRLKERCQFHRQGEQWAEAAGWCAAHESYQVID